MKKLLLSTLLVLLISSVAFCAVFSYSFPKSPRSWGDPVSFNNLSPGFFQIMFLDKGGVVRIATYGIAGGSMDELKDPQLVMVFTFDKSESTKVGLKINE